MWDLAVTDDSAAIKHLTINWTGHDLTMTGGNETLVIKDYVNGTFGITLENAAPVASNDSVSTVKNINTVIDVLATDTDADGTLNPSTVAIVDGPDHGSVTIDTATGKITYTPTTNYVGRGQLHLYGEGRRRRDIQRSDREHRRCEWVHADRG